MKYIINGGVYAVDLKGTNDAEFVGIHPSVIIKSIKNEDMYYIIPLSTYTKERWENYRKLLCCRVESSNSIARIDKLQLRHKDKIPKRWLEGKSLIILLPEEIDKIYKRSIEYLELSTATSKKEYDKFYNNYQDFTKCITDLFCHFNFKTNINFNLSFTENKLKCVCSLDLVSKLSFDDVKRIVWSVFQRENVNINYDKKNLFINVSLKDKNALTFKEKYDSFILTEGQLNT